ncbi:hypothetical protein DM813_23230 [Pseudomonas alkylphenolica]|uniref:TubC N-terminal docking domain-containing protein n=1 Tax=Pseudomonas alkylphenolica TaxID=237609 RepID=A0A443ZK10_9PSED|nr:hypothetical protein [Pseudomonas alkylphenolica]RWU19221.1 hypothetical protein DM813_23230 [Pseudomonas alkylphenolica]
MTAFEVLALAKAEGMVLTLNGELLTWKADHLPPHELLTEMRSHRQEIIESLAATEQAWLADVARLLACSPAYLISFNFIDRYDLSEQYDTLPAFAAHLILSHPRWPPPQELKRLALKPYKNEPQYLHRSTTIADPQWCQAHDLYIGHLMSCRSCHAPTNRYCTTGAELRDQYNAAS